MPMEMIEVPFRSADGNLEGCTTQSFIFAFGSACIPHRCLRTVAELKGAFKMACHNLTCLPLITMSPQQPLNQLSTAGTDSALDGRTPRQSVILVGTVVFHTATGLRLCHSNHLPLHGSTLSAKASKNRPTYGHPGTFLSPRAVQVLIRQLVALLDFDTGA